MKKNKIIILATIILLLTISIIFLMKDEPMEKSDITYEITYNGLNCPTAYLKLYPDNTYEYFQYYTVGDEELKPEKGNYEYDINKIIKNISKSEENKYGPYTIKTSDGKVYTTYNSNKKLKEFLDKYNLVLEKCITEKE